MILNEELRRTADEIVAKYPNSRSATLPLLFLVQSVEGYVSDDGMREVAEILGLAPAEVLAAGSFYSMLKRKPQGEYLISVCRNISCTHRGAKALFEAFEERLGIETGQTTEDGKVTLEAAECLATCDGAPSLQVNYEDFYDVTPKDAVNIVDKLERDAALTSVRGERVRTAKQISYEIATAGLRGGRGPQGVAPGMDSDSGLPTVGGEVQPPDMAPGFRPKETGVEE